MSTTVHDPIPQCDGFGCAGVLMALLRNRGVQFSRVEVDGSFITLALTPEAVVAVQTFGRALSSHQNRIGLLLRAE